MCEDICVTINQTVENIVVEVRDFSINNIISSDAGNNATTGTDGLIYVPMSISGVSSVNGFTGDVIIDKNSIDLGNVDNTSDVDKPISIATQQALDLKANASDLGDVATSNDYNDLDNLPTIPQNVSDLTNDVGYLTSFTETDPIFQASEASLFVAGDKDNLDNQSGVNTGDETTSSIQAKRPLKTINGKSLEGNGNVQIDYNDLDNIPTIITNHSDLNLDDGTNPHGTTKNDVGLSNVDNTSDLNKPISTATQNVLNNKLDKVSTVTTERQFYIKNADGTQAMVNESEISGGGGLDKLITNNHVSGTYEVDFGIDTHRLTLTGNTTFTEVNLPIPNFSKTITLHVQGDYGLILPTSWNTYLSGSYDGTATLNTIVIETFGAERKVQISQPD